MLILPILKFSLWQALSGRREELDYDDTKNCILEIEEDLQQLRKKLKLVKKNSKTRYGHDLDETDSHDITEILLKVVLNTINLI
jgi:hypothetical protein